MVQRVEAGKPDDSAPRSVLFICSMNVIRSPMASAITRTLFPKTVYARSAGIHAGENDPFVMAVMNEVGVDISTHLPHTFEDLDDNHFDLMITLTEEARLHLAGMWQVDVGEVEFWSLPDPTLETGSREQRLEAYRAVRDTLVSKIKDRFGWHL